MAGSAREKTEEARKSLDQGIDPGAMRQAEKMAHADTLEAVAREFFSKQAKKLAPQTIKRDPKPLEEHTFETLGRAPARPRCRTAPGAGPIPGRIARGVLPVILLHGRLVHLPGRLRR